MIPFTKAHACGNDFLIVPQDEIRGHDLETLTQRLCERNTGIGADGVEYFQWLSDTSGRIHLRNADGSVAEISGNGTRCVAAYMAEERNAQPGDELSIQTDAGVRVCTIREFRDSDYDGPTVLITTDMDMPEFEERTIELADGSSVDGIYVSMGNPHFVIVMSPAQGQSYPTDNMQIALSMLDFSINRRSWVEIGEEICQHPDFPDQTNVEFVHVIGGSPNSADRVAIRIFERGVGPTTSSGTGTCAAATAMIGVHQAASQLEVFSPGGTQTVRWEGPDQNLYLTGPATLVARGEFY